MQLPGGMLAENGRVVRDVGLRPLTGAVQLALWDAASDAASGRSDRIDGLLSAAVELPAPGGPEALTVADRQFLLVQIARALGHARFWLTGTCGDCGSPFDACIELADVPVKPAGPGFPYAVADLPTGRVRVRAPTGADQAAISGIDDPLAAVAALARRLVVDGPDDLDEAALAAIDAAAQEVSPEAAQALATTCPDCGADNALPFDIAALLAGTLGDPLDEIHEIASVYHWGEAEILALSPARRRAYLDRIDRDREVQR
jgi:hypothetical protein